MKDGINFALFPDILVMLLIFHQLLTLAVRLKQRSLSGEGYGFLVQVY